MALMRDLLDLQGDLPDDRLPSALMALWWLRKGGLAVGQEWQRAHGICQRKEGDAAHDLVHALAHWIEGDDANARYWYRRVGGARAATIELEWQRVAALLCPDRSQDADAT